MDCPYWVKHGGEQLPSRGAPSTVLGSRVLTVPLCAQQHSTRAARSSLSATQQQHPQQHSTIISTAPGQPTHACMHVPVIPSTPSLSMHACPATDNDGIAGLDVCPNGRRLATCGTDPQVVIWNMLPILDEAAEQDAAVPKV